MKFTIDRTALIKPLGHVQSVVERRNTIPILSNVVLKAEDGMLSMTATDMDTGGSPALVLDFNLDDGTTETTLKDAFPR